MHLAPGYREFLTSLILRKEAGMSSCYVSAWKKAFPGEPVPVGVEDVAVAAPEDEVVEVSSDEEDEAPVEVLPALEPQAPPAPDVAEVADDAPPPAASSEDEGDDHRPRQKRRL
jgi:hypothetical protein